jgi:hypothetical protein
MTIKTSEEREAEWRDESRALSAVIPTLPNGEVDIHEAARRGVYDDVLDQLHSTQGDASGGEAEAERVREWETRFLRAIQAGANRVIMADPHALRIMSAHYDQLEDCYSLECRDMDKTSTRAYYVKIPSATMLDVAVGGEDTGRRLIDLAARECIEAKRRYFARML